MATMTLQDLTFSNYSGAVALNITSSGEYTLDNCTFDGSGDYEVEVSHPAGAVTMSLINNTTALTAGDITGSGLYLIENNKTLTLTGMVSGTEVTIVSASIELFHEENVSSSGSINYVYNYEANKIVDILIFHVDYDPNLSSIFNYTLLSTDATIPIQQIDDRVYNNPV